MDRFLKVETDVVVGAGSQQRNLFYLLKTCPPCPPTRKSPGQTVFSCGQVRTLNLSNVLLSGSPQPVHHSTTCPLDPFATRRSPYADAKAGGRAIPRTPTGV